MSDHARKLADARAARDAARAVFDAQMFRVRGDPEAQSLGGRIASRFGEDAKTALHGAMEVAGESKGVIAGTIAALALWFLRNPIIAWADSLLTSDEDSGDQFYEEKTR